MSVSLDGLTEVLASPRLREHRGLGEPPFFILPYEPRESVSTAVLRAKLPQRLSERAITALDIDLYDLTVELLAERGLWDRVLSIESEVSKEELRELMQNVLDPETHLTPAIKARMADAEPFDLLLIGGVGEVFPFVRSHSVLNNLARVVGEKPVLLFFPGEFAQGTSGASLRLFGRVPNDRFYRATDIRGLIA